MEITTTTIHKNNSGTRAAINGLAVVGFIALLVLGVGLAIYSTRYLHVSSRLNSASVYFSSLFTSHKNDLTVVPETVSFGGSGLISSSTATTTGSAPAATTTGSTAATHSTPGAATSHTYTVGGGTPAPATFYGQPDLTVTVATTGYLTTDSTDSFVPALVVPPNMKPAVKFTVANVGTNISVPWFFTAILPTNPSYTFSSAKQPVLLPGDRIDYVLGFDRPSSGNNKSITITVDSGNDVAESNETNNVTTRTIDISI